MVLSVTTNAWRSAPFDVLATTYDEVFSDSCIGRAQRESVWREMDRLFQPGLRILEINCGTGVDALHLARCGIRVVACDIAPEMIAAARQRLAHAGLEGSVEFRVLATERVRDLGADAPFDGVLSNFAGLNCIEDISSVATDLAALVSPGAKVLLCLFGRICLWEIIWYLSRGNWRKAFRRLRREGCEARLANDSTVTVRYPSVRSVQRSFAPYFRLEKQQGVGVAVPPSYLEPLADCHQRAFQVAVKLDSWLSRIRGARSLGDHILFIFERTAS